MTFLLEIIIDFVERTLEVIQIPFRNDVLFSLKTMWKCKSR